MRSIIKVALLTLISITFLTTQPLAGGKAFPKGPNYNKMNKSQIVNGLDVRIQKNINNGFPSGPHYNLNIIGKKDAFTCPPAETDANGAPIYGNVIFVPEVTLNDRSLQDPTQIYFESGLKGPKSAPTITELQVRDWCTGFLGTGSATLLLPKNDAGYDVYARALAKPTNNPNVMIDPSLVWLQDELGNDLYYLGTLGSVDYFSWGTNTFYRKKGKSPGLDITPLFEYSGEVCYLTAPLDSTGYTEKPLCGLDTNIDGIYEDIVLADYVTYPTTGCPTSYVLIPVGYCRAYNESWVFNIADFVQYLWGLDNSGVKLLQIRFYPK
jgi:hypothetical protein